jgi:hypothetical protein
MSKLIHPEFSYQVRGVLLKVYNTLGPMLKEAYYRDAIILGLKKCQMACQAEKMFVVYPPIPDTLCQEINQIPIESYPGENWSRQRLRGDAPRRDRPRPRYRVWARNL